MQQILLLITLLLSVSNLEAQNFDENNFKATVIQVYDGDSITVETEANRIFKIRLSDIDAPEKKQHHGIESRDYLRKLVLGKTVNIIKTDIDGYGRTVAKVYLENTYINREMVKSGMAWFYDEYSKDEELKKLQQKAKKSRLGLWQEETPKAPWQYRKGKRNKSKKQSFRLLPYEEIIVQTIIQNRFSYLS